MTITSVEDTLLAAIALPLVAGPVAYVLDRVSRPARNWLVVLTLAANLALALRLALAGVSRTYVVQVGDPAAGPLPVELSLSVGGAGGVSLTVVAFVCLAVGTFSTGYVQPGRFVGGYFALLLLAAAALDAVLLAGDLVTLSAGLALLAASLSGLVGLDFARGAGGAAAKLLLMVGASASLAASAAWLILARGGSVALDGLLARNTGALGAWLPVVAGLLLIALAIAAALPPGHTWLTSGSRHAVTPVVALLAGGVLPAGLVVWLRVLAPAPGVASAWPAVALLGGLSVAVGALGALRTPEFRLALAYQALGQSGLAAVALAEGTAEGRAIAIFQVVALALFLPALILGVGAVLQVTKGDLLEGFPRLRAVQPGVAALALVGAASVAGVPPLPGYWSRVWLVEVLLRPGQHHLLLLAVVVLGTTLLTGSAFRLLSVEPAVGVPVPPRRRTAALVPLAALAAVGALLPFVPPSLAFRVVGAAPAGAGVPSYLEVVAALLALATLGAGAALRLGELDLLPPQAQAAFDGVAERLAFCGVAVAGVKKRVRPEWLDPYAVVGGLLALAAWAAALVLDNTLGRLGRSG